MNFFHHLPPVSDGQFSVRQYWWSHSAYQYHNPGPFFEGFGLGWQQKSAFSAAVIFHGVITCFFCKVHRKPPSRFGTLFCLKDTTFLSFEQSFFFYLGLFKNRNAAQPDIHLLRFLLEESEALGFGL